MLHSSNQPLLAHPQYGGLFSSSNIEWEDPTAGNGRRQRRWCCLGYHQQQFVMLSRLCWMCLTHVQHLPRRGDSSTAGGCGTHEHAAEYATATGGSRRRRNCELAGAAGGRSSDPTGFGRTRRGGAFHDALPNGGHLHAADLFDYHLSYYAALVELSRARRAAENSSNLMDVARLQCHILSQSRLSVSGRISGRNQGFLRGVRDLYLSELSDCCPGPGQP